MKHNGQNIIFDEDVTLTGSLAGQKLSDIIREQAEEIERLKSNLKWIYKYGGVGGSGGSGGGGGSASGYVLFASLGSVQMSNQSVAFNGEGNYDLYIKITRPNGASFRVTYSYEVMNSSGVKTTASTTVTLDVSRNYEYSATLNLNCNGRVTVTAVDSIYNETKANYLDYIIESYSVTGSLVDDTGKVYDSNEIFTSEAGTRGLKYRVSYDIAVESSGNTCYFVFSKGNEIHTATADLEGSRGYYDFDIKDFIALNEANSGYYSVTATVNLNLVGQRTDPIVMVTSFNLVPQQLFLLVQPSTGSIYTEHHSDYATNPDVYKYGAGFISFNVRPYLGSETSATAEIKYYVIDAEGNRTNDFTGTGISTKLGSQTEISIYAGTPGHCRIFFQVTSSGTTYPSPDTAGAVDGYIVYHFYIEAMSANIDWYSEDMARTATQNYWRLAEHTNSMQAFENLAKSNIYQQTANKGDITLSNLTLPANISGGASYNSNIAIGIQFNEVNSETTPILTGKYKGATALVLTQNSVTIHNTTFPYFLPKIRNYNKSDNQNYHLVNIVSRKVSRIGNFDYFEVAIYVDGILEGGSQTFTSQALIIDQLIIGQTNSFINLLESTYMVAPDVSVPLDNDIYRYYLKYKNRIILSNVSDDELTLLTYSDKFTLDGNDVYCTSSDVIENIARVLDVPTLVLTMAQDYKVILDAGYNENDEIDPIEVSVRYAAAHGNLLPIEFPTEFMGTAYFTIQIQGSSTKTYKCKNYTLTLNNRDESETASHFVYSPNYKSVSGLTGDAVTEAYKTFLPEESFTLKADVVDSSHSNNTSIGKFVNDVTKDFDTTSYTNSRNNLMGYTKNCLDGFPCVVYLCIPRVENGITTTYYYYQGVYNFNLGRESFYNLGYKDASVFCDATGTPKLKDAGTGFCFHRVENSEDYSLKNGLVVAEIQGNSPYFDFSQWDSTILYKSLSSVSKDNETYMFDDFVTGSDLNEASAKTILQNFVKNVSLAGGYLFNEIKKKFGDSTTDYGYRDGYSTLNDQGNPANQVPNYRVHIKKSLSGETQVFNVDPSVTINAGELNDLSALILGDNGDNGFLDFRSLSEYYTICMAFGLVDSVQKNMNLKSWNANAGSGRAKFYTAFYDMDTCLGINNAGKDVSYFAFSDYWSYDDSNVDSEGTVTPTSVTIYRDFSPRASSGSTIGAADFYDTPSSYLFAVAKYARLRAANMSINGETLGIAATALFPQELWAKWRAGTTDEGDATVGCLASAEHFMNNYFSNNLGKVGIPMVNLNYRNKYFIKSTNKDVSQTTTGYSALNFAKFNGTRIAKATDWLDGRFHILDAYFNLPKSTSSFQYYNDNGNYVNVPIAGTTDQFLGEPTYESSAYNLADNSDIFVLQDIFAGQGGVNQTAGDLDINVKAKEYSPLIINTANSGVRYLLGGNDKKYHIRVPLSGNQTYSFYGSGSWTDLDSINTFNFTTLNVSTKYLESLSGDSTRTNMVIGTINMPSLKNLSLTSRTYSGELVITGEQYPNLGLVNVSNSQIKLDIQNSTFTNLNISNMTTEKVSVLGCTNLQNVVFGTGGSGTVSTTIDNLQIQPMSASQLRSGVTINNSRIKNLTMVNTTYTGNRTKLVIQNDEALTTISVRGISDVEVIGCPNLTNLYIQDPETPTSGDPNGDYLTTIVVRNCGTVNTDFRVGSATTTTTTVDLTNFSHLSVVEFRNIPGMVTCMLSTTSTVTLGNSAFADSNNMRTLSGQKIILNGTGIFSNCGAFTMKTETGAWTNMEISNSLTSLNSMFSTNVGSAITLEAARRFITNVVGSKASQITSMSSTFHGQSQIVYGLSQLRDDLRGSSNYIDLSSFTNLSNVSGLFAWSGVRAIHKKMVAFGANVSTVSFSRFLFYGDLYMEIDALANVIDKIDYLWDSSPDYQRYISTLHIVNSNGVERTDTIPLKDFFHPGGKHPTRLVELSRFELAKGQTFDMADVFKNWTSLTTLHSAFYNNHARLINLNELFKYATGLKYVYDSLRISNTSEPVDLMELFNWDVLITNNTHDIFTENSSYRGEGSFAMTKYIKSLNEFETLVRKLIGPSTTSSTRLTGISNIFRQCTVFITDPSQAQLNLEALSINNNIVSMNSTFRDFKMVVPANPVTQDNVVSEIGGTPEFIALKEGLFTYVPKVAYLNRTFLNMRIANSIPYNFFGLRRIKRYQYYVKDGSDYLIGNYYNHTYDAQLVDLSCMFMNVRWYSENGGVNARFFQDDPEILSANRFEVLRVDGSTVTNEVIRTITDPDEVYYQRREDPIYDEQGNPTGEVSVRYVAAGKIGSNTEITDTENLRGNYKHSFSISLRTSGGSDFVNLFTNFGVDEAAVNSLFIAPDFFYGCKSTASISYCFSNSAGYDDYCLEGIIPEHLLKNCPNVNLTHLFQNLHIIPRYLWTVGTEGTDREIYNVYYYVPKNFTKATDLSNAFTFNFIAPECASTDGNGVTRYNKYYVLLDMSISKDVSSLSDALPSRGYSGLTHDSVNGRWPNSHTYDYAIHYNIMYNIADDNGTELTTGSDGIDMNYFKSLRIDNLVPAIISFFGEGDLFNGTTFTINNAAKTDTAYAITAFNQTNNVISRNLKLPRATGSWENKRLINWTGDTLSLPLWDFQIPADSISSYRTMENGSSRRVIVESSQ